MAKKIANKTENAALQGANVLAAQSVAIKTLAAELPQVKTKSVEFDLLTKKKAAEFDTEQQAVVTDDQQTALDVMVVGGDQGGALQGSDIVLAQAGNTAPSASTPAATTAGTGISGGMVAAGVVGAAAIAGGGGSSATAAPVPTYAISKSAASVSEGDAVVFTITTTNLVAGTKIGYVLSGVNVADVVGGSLTGEATVGADGKAYVTVALTADATTEGAETLTMTAAGATAAVTVNDTSTTVVPTYAISKSAASVNEGEAVVFTITTTHVVAGTNIGYALSGVNAADVVGGSLTGEATVGADGKAYVTVTLASDATNEGTETLTITAAGATASVTVIDPSSFTLSADQETFTGGVGNDVFNSAPAFGGIALVDTYVADTLIGGKGSDTLNITATSGGYFQASEIENINIRTLATNGGGGLVSIDMEDVTGVETLTAHSLRSALALDNVGEVSTVVYKDNTQVADSDLTINYDESAVDGVADSLNMTAENNSGGGTVTVNGIETVSLTSVGTNDLELSAADATLNIDGAGDLDLVADDVAEVNNAATGAVTLSAQAATAIDNSGDDLTLTAVANKADVTNSGEGSLEVDVAADDLDLENSDIGTLTVTDVGQNATITNSGSGELVVDNTDTGATITNSGAGNTTITGSQADVVVTSGEGNLTVEEDAFAAKATITASGSGALTVTVLNNDVTIDASESTGDVTVTLAENGTSDVTFTGSEGDDLVVAEAGSLGNAEKK